MEKSFYRLYKNLKNKLNKDKAFIDVSFLQMDGEKIKNEYFVRLIYFRERGIELFEFTKNVFGYSTYIGFNDDFKRIENDASIEQTSISFLAKNPKRKSKVSDFALNNIKIRRGYSKSKINTKDKERIISFLLLLSIILESEEDNKIFLDTLVTFDENGMPNINARNYGTMLVMYDPLKFFYHVATEYDLKPMMETIYQIKERPSDLLKDISIFKDAEFDYFMNLSLFKNTLTDEVYALITAADKDSNSNYFAYKLFKVDKKLKNLNDSICSAIYMIFEEFGVPSVINTVSPIIYEYLIPLIKNGIEITFIYDQFHSALTRHITNMLWSYSSYYEVKNLNLETELLDSIFSYFTHLVLNGFNPVEHYLIENNKDLYQLFDQFREYLNENDKEEIEEIDNDDFIN